MWFSLLSPMSTCQYQHLVRRSVVVDEQVDNGDWIEDCVNPWCLQLVPGYGCLVNYEKLKKIDNCSQSDSWDQNLSPHMAL